MYKKILGTLLKLQKDKSLFKTQQIQDWENSPPTPELGLSGAGTVEVVFGDYQLTLWLRSVNTPCAEGIPAGGDFTHSTAQKGTLKEREWPGNLVALGRSHTYLVVGIQVLGHFSDRQVLLRRLRITSKSI